MKKNFLKHGFAAAFALVAGYGVYASQQKVLETVRAEKPA